MNIKIDYNQNKIFITSSYLNTHTNITIYDNDFEQEMPDSEF